MKLEIFEERLTVCQLKAIPDLSAMDGFRTLTCTDDEISLVCTESSVPANPITREDGWRMVRVAGPLEFSLIGILAALAETLARAGIPIFAVSTFNTDYLLVKQEHFDHACAALSDAGHTLTAIR